MATKNIKGITIVIDGDTKKLSDALKDVDKKVYDLNGELKLLNSALKLDPKNTELLSEKQQVLKKNIEETTSRLNTLKEAQKSLGDYNNLSEEQQRNYRALSVEIAKSEDALKKLENEYKSFGSVATQQLKQVGKELEETGKKITSAGTSLTKSVTAPIAGLMTAGVTYNAQMEKYQAALTSITGSAEQADKIIAQIKEDAARTPFDVSGLVQANQLLLSTGLSAEESRETILALGDAIAATGGGDEELSRMAVNLQQIKNVGQATALDIKQFAYAGIDVYGLLADYLGVTKEEASQMKITWDDLNGALIKSTKEGGKYYQAMDKQSKTFNGRISNLKDTIGTFTGELAESLMPILEKVIDFVNSLMEKFNELDPQTQSIISTTLLVVAAIGPVIIIIGQLITSVGAITAAIGGLLPIIGAVVAAITSPVGLIVGAIAAVVAAVVLLYNKCEWFRDGVNAVFEFIKNIVMTIVNFISNNWQNLLTLIVNPFAGAFKLLYDNCEWFKTFVNNAVTNVIDFFKSIPGKIAAIPGQILDLFKNIINNIKEVGANLMNGLVDGLKEKWNQLKDSIANLGNSIVDKFKAIFGIQSPSKVMKNEVGKYLAEGIGVGFETEMKSVNKEMADSISISGITGNISSALRGINYGMNNSINPQINPSITYDQNYQLMADAMKEAMKEVKVELDDVKMGEFIDNTVTKEIFAS